MLTAMLVAAVLGQRFIPPCPPGFERRGYPTSRSPCTDSAGREPNAYVSPPPKASVTPSSVGVPSDYVPVMQDGRPTDPCAYWQPGAIGHPPTPPPKLWLGSSEGIVARPPTPTPKPAALPRSERVFSAALAIYAAMQGGQPEARPRCAMTGGGENGLLSLASSDACAEEAVRRAERLVRAWERGAK